MNYILTIYGPNDSLRYFVVADGKPGRLVDSLEEAQKDLDKPRLVEEHVKLKRGEIQSDAALISIYNIYPDLYTALVDSYPLRKHNATA